MTQSELARRSGCSRSSVKRAAVRRPSDAIAERIAVAVGASAEAVWPLPSAPDDADGLCYSWDGLAFRRLREARGLRTSELADRVGCSRRTVERAENPRNDPPSLRIRRVLLAELGVGR